MCDDYEGDMCDVWDETRRRARKRHECWACKEAILPGQIYQRSTVIWEGTAQSWKHCLRCAVLIDALKKRMGTYTTEIFDLNCGEIWNDPPPEIAALAFFPPARRDHCRA